MVEKLSENIWHNGELIRWEDATVHVMAHALHYGSSIFEGVRAYTTPSGPAVFRLKEHTRRLFRSAKIMQIDIPYSEDEINLAILDTIRANNHQECYIRPVIFRGAGRLGVEGRSNPIETYIITFPWGAYLGQEAIEKGVDVQVSSWRRMAPDTHPAMAKAGGNYVNSQMIVMEAKDNGFVEGIALDVFGYVSEGSGENIFVIMDGVVYTPGVGNSILQGITRESALTLLKEQGYEIRYASVAREMLYIADEIFFTGTAAEITPIRSIDRIPIGSGSRGPVTKQIQDEFFAIVSGEVADRFNWLTPVGE